MILQAAITSGTTVGLTLSEILAGLGIIGANGLVIAKGWFNFRLKIREQDLRITNMETVILKNEYNTDKFLEHLDKNTETNKTLLMELHSRFSEHLGYHKGHGEDLKT